MALLKLEDVLEELEQNHNWSIYDEMYHRNKNNLQKVALYYRGKNITYDEMFEQMRYYANALISCGIKEDSSIAVCMSNIPEFVYLLGAASIAKVKLKIFGEEFDPDYITKIINRCENDFMFITEDKYNKLKETIANSKVSKIVMSSLTDSLPAKQDPFKILDDSFYKFENKIKDYQNENNYIQSLEEFGKNQTDINIFSRKVKLDDEFTTTFSSGSTNSSTPKAIVHRVRSYITMGRFHDPEVSGTPSMKNLRILAHIPTHSNTNIMSCITDTLMQGATVCLEPIYQKDFFLYSIFINKPNFLCATRSFWVHLAKTVRDIKKKYGIRIKFPYLFAPMSVGEPLSQGEEKLTNRMLKETMTGVDMTHTPVSVVSMSVAGGDCEHGGIFFIMFRNLMNKLRNIPKDEYDILRTYSMVDVVVLDENDKPLEHGKLGRLYAASPCNMKEYEEDEEATQQFFKVINGKKYGDCSVYGFKDKKGYIHIKGRIKQLNGTIPLFLINEEICKDTKKILSCETIEQMNDGNLVYVLHIEIQPDVKVDIPKTLLSAQKRCEKKFGKDVASKMIFRLRSYGESYPLTGCGKRNGIQLQNEGISPECVIPMNIENNVILVNALEHMDKIASQKGTERQKTKML